MYFLFLLLILCTNCSFCVSYGPYSYSPASLKSLQRLSALFPGHEIQINVEMSKDVPEGKMPTLEQGKSLPSRKYISRNIPRSQQKKDETDDFKNIIKNIVREEMRRNNDKPTENPDNTTSNVVKDVTIKDKAKSTIETTRKDNCVEEFLSKLAAQPDLLKNISLNLSEHLKEFLNIKSDMTIPRNIPGIPTKQIQHVTDLMEIIKRGVTLSYEQPKRFDLDWYKLKVPKQV